MDNRKEKIPVGISFMGRNLGELLELKARCRRRLEYLDQNRERISSYVYDKLRLEYSSYLEAVDGEVALGLSEYEIKLAEIRLFSNQLKLLEKSYAERIQELALRFALGEYSRHQYDKLCTDHKDRMRRFAQSIEKYSGERRKLEEFLGRVAADGVLSAFRIALEEEPAAGTAGLKEADTEAGVTATESAAGPDMAQELAGPLGEVAEELEESFAEVPAFEDTQSGPRELPLEELVPEAEPEMDFPAAREPEAVDTAEVTGPAETLESAGQSSMEPAEEISLRPSSAFLIDESAEASLETTLQAESGVGQIDKKDVILESGMPKEGLPEEPRPAEMEAQAAEEAAEIQDSGPGLEEIPSFENPEIEEQGAPLEAESFSSSAGTSGLPGLQEMSEESALRAEEPQTEVPVTAGEQAPQSASKPAADLEALFASAEARPMDGEEKDISEPAAAEHAAQLSAAPEAPGQEQAGAVEAVFDLEKELLQEAQGGQTESSGSGEQRAENNEPAAGETSGGLDLDAIINASGAALQNPPETPAVKEIVQAEPPAAENPDPAAEPGPLSLDEPELTETLKEVEEAGEPEARVEKEIAADTGPHYAEPQMPEASLEEIAPEGQDEAEDADEMDKLGLQPVISLDEKIELNLDLEDRAGETDKLLTVNQTIDAIKRKTVKCPACGTMNYAIRWYCEKCEATLTAL